jgi:hypothetical protein
MSYTKVNRCLKEGRRAVCQRAAAIDAGEGCERLAPPLIRVAEGGSGLDELPAL